MASCGSKLALALAVLGLWGCRGSEDVTPAAAAETGNGQAIDAPGSAAEVDAPPDAGVRQDDAGTGRGDGAQDAGEPAAACPPAPPYGNELGEPVPDVVLRDCDGVQHRLHDLCDRRASVFLLFSGS